MYKDVLFGQEQTSDNKVLNELAEKLTEYLRELPVLGFNSGKYDLNAVEKILFLYLIEHHPIKFTVKRNNNHMCLKTDFLKLLDISNYLAPGFSYDQFLRGYECKHTKGFFPYEWVDWLDKLDETSLPPHAAFYSSLKNTNITEQEYEYCQQGWEENNMQSFEDFSRVVQQPGCGAVYRSGRENESNLSRKEDRYVQRRDFIPWSHPQVPLLIPLTSNLL